MKEITILTDYKGHFGSKSNSKYYRGGMDLNLLISEFNKLGYKSKIISFIDVDFRDKSWGKSIVIYTSQEDYGYFYKQYIEDIVYGLELLGALVIPKHKYLRANNNKVFMEILRDLSCNKNLHNIISQHYGTAEDVIKRIKIHNPHYPRVIKSAAGALSDGVHIGLNEKDFIKKVKKVSKLNLNKEILKDFFRPYKHKGYIRESRFRKKFIVQNFISGLANDWKILIFGDRFYIEYRGIRNNDFRASGSKRFRLNEDIPVPIPIGIFEFAEDIKKTLNTPHLSIDIGYKQNNFYLFEFQALYFSSYAHRKSKTYYIKRDDRFIKINESLSLEKVYADSLCDYLGQNLST